MSMSRIPAKAILWTGVLYLMLVFAFLAALTLVNKIPNERILKHVRGSFSHENYRYSLTGITRMDHYTECIVLTMGLSDSASNMGSLTRSLLSPTVGQCDWTREALLRSEKHGFNYWRFWHGYQIVSRPVLYFTDAHGLRLICFLIFSLSYLLLFQSIRTNINFSFSMISALTLLVAPLYSQLYLIHFSLVWALGFSLAAFLLYSARQVGEIFKRYYLWMFGVVGMLTAYFDLLTNPLVTLTIPLLVLYWKDDWPGKKQSRPAWMTVLMIVTAWSAGYFSCWGAKWILASFVLEQSVVLAIGRKIACRLGSEYCPDEDIPVTALNSILRNLYYWKIGIFAVLSLAAVAALKTVHRAKGLVHGRRQFGNTMTFLSIFLLPFAWLALARNHSTIHAWFVAPILYPSFALLIGELWRTIRSHPTYNKKKDIAPGAGTHG